MFLHSLQCKKNCISYSILQVNKNGRALTLYMLTRMGFYLETNKYNDEGKKMSLKKELVLALAKTFNFHTCYLVKLILVLHWCPA